MIPPWFNVKLGAGHAWCPVSALLLLSLCLFFVKVIGNPGLALKSSRSKVRTSSARCNITETGVCHTHAGLLTYGRSRQDLSASCVDWRESFLPRPVMGCTARISNAANHSAPFMNLHLRLGTVSFTHETGAPWTRRHLAILSSTGKSIFMTGRYIECAYHRQGKGG